jgi:nucleoside-diphosphate-sugar epimerase
MTGRKRILVTGASGCVGHYVADALIRETDHELFLMVRNPDRLKLDPDVRSGVTVVPTNMKDIEQLADLLPTIDTAVLTAAAWGGPEVAWEINVVKTLQLLKLLDPDRCQQVIYFSTASILDRNNQPLKEAETIGTGYIRSKYACYQRLASLAIAPKITTLFPTLLMGGDASTRLSHISEGIVQVANWIWLLRFFKADGSFHFIHAKDVGQIVRHFVDHPPQPGNPRQYVLGNDAITLNQAIEETCDYLNQRIYFRIPLTMKLANLLITVFRIQMEPWDRFAFQYRHFVHRSPITPSSFGIPTYCSTFKDVLKLSGVVPAMRR